MDFTAEMDAAIASGFFGFQEFIQTKFKTYKTYLLQTFWMEGGGQISVLNYLISKYQHVENQVAEEGADSGLNAMINYVLELMPDKNFSEPLHHAVSLGKISLALRLFKSDDFDYDRRDHNGQTLLSLVLASRNVPLLQTLLTKNPNVFNPSRITVSSIQFPPLHQAIILDYAEAVRLLMKFRSQFENPIGSRKDTPLILAAGQGKINALEAILDFNINFEEFDLVNSVVDTHHPMGLNAMDALCKRMYSSKDKLDTLRGIAMLLCNGAEPPQDENTRAILCGNREALLKAVRGYLEKKPELVDAFVNRCHLTEGALHNIVYADHSWGSSLRRLFGIPSQAGFIVEELVHQKYQELEQNDKSVHKKPTLRKDQIALRMYAEFVSRYKRTYENQWVVNCWSAMRFMIAEGHCDWEVVKRYAQNHPGTRTHTIVQEMLGAAPEVHHNIDEVDNASVHLSIN